MNSLVASAIGGLLATAPMTVVMTTLFQKLQRSEQYPLPPREITEVFVASYLGWLPAAKILRPATQHPPSRNMLMLLAHVVWGAGTVLIGEALRSKRMTQHFL